MPRGLAALCALLGKFNQQSHVHNVPLTNLQVMELQRAVAKIVTAKQAAAAVQAKTDEKAAEELRKVAPSYPKQPP